MTSTADKNQNHLFLTLSLVGFSLLFIYFAKISLVLSLVFAAIFLLTIILYQKPEIGICLILFSLLGGQLLKINIGEGDSGLLLSDIIVPFILLVWFLRVIIKKEKIVSTFIGPFLFLFLSIAVISLINGLRFLDQEEMIISSLYLARLLSYGLLFFAVSTIFSKNEKGLYRLNQVLITIFILFALAGIFQLIYFPDLTAWSIKYGWDPHIGRLFSTFLDPNFAGTFLTIGFIVSLALFSFAKSLEAKVILGLATMLTLVTTILTYSRSTYLFLFISFFIFSIIKSKRLLLVGVATLIVLLLIFPRSLERIEGGFQVDKSARLRFESWGKTLEIIQDYPLIGVGYNGYRFAQQRYNFLKVTDRDRSAGGSDASLLTIFATTGILGLLSYLMFYFAALLKAKKVYTYSHAPPMKALALATLAILVGLIFNSIFINSLLYPAIMIPLFIVLGLISTEPA